MRLSFIVSLLTISVLIVSCKKTNKQSDETYENYVILVSFDGFRWDYTDLYVTPNFDDMALDGVKAERLIPSFPTKTFPNHYTIATGLYPDHHGLVSNKFYAPDLGLMYSIGNRAMVQNADFYGGEPIWNTAEKQGMISASFYWVGSEAPIGGIEPTYSKIYDGSVPFSDRVDTVIHWLKLPLEKRPRFITLYFHEPDGVGHNFGPVHTNTGLKIKELDAILGDLRNQISKLTYGDKVNLIVTSDHGMGEISPKCYVNIYDHVGRELIEADYGSNPVYLLDAVDGYEDSVAIILDQIEGISAWKKEDVPVHLKYGSHPRISDIVVAADSAWSVGVKQDASGYSGGTHGYDNSNSDMHAIFYADGPAFKDNYIQAPFENVSIYALIAHILDLEPEETDGNLEDVDDMLK